MARKVIDNVGLLASPKAMMQAIDDNFTELYTANPTVWAYVSSSAPTTIVTAGTYYPIQGTFVNDVLGFGSATVVAPGIKYLNAETRKFTIFLNSQVSASVLNTNVTTAVLKNGVLVPGSPISSRCRDAGSPYGVYGIAVVELSTDDEVQLVATSDGSGDVLTFSQLQTIIHPHN